MTCATKNEQIEELKLKLLAVGGDSVSPLPYRYLDIVLARGRTFETKGRRLLRDELHRCPAVAALYYARHYALDHGGTCEIVTGYGLGDDGMWWPHCWVWDGKRVIEPNIEPVRYFGTILGTQEAGHFVIGEVFSSLPYYTSGEWRDA
jgi:hypothetical protein